MPPLAVSTVFVVQFAFNLLATAFLGGSWRAGRSYPGLPHWTLAAVLATLGGPLIAARPVLPIVLSALVGSGLLLAAQVLVLVGLRHFSGTGETMGRPTAVLLAAAALAFLFFLLARPSVGVRVMIYSACAAWFSAACAWHCLRRIDAAIGSPATFLAALFAVLSVGHLARLATAAVVTLGGSDPGLFDRAQLESSILLVNLVSFSVVLFTLPSLRQRRLLLDLERSAAQVRKLEGILPICMYCKRIRDAGDSWQVLEAYISERSAAAFSHGICPDCLVQHFPGRSP
jgi:hypothetical protein